jgi:cyclopropane fatty-acyl-phospholipid synthase-like methyltransferase
MFNKNTVTSNIIKSFSENIGFPVYTAEELQKMYQAFDVDPKSTDRRVFDTESMSHHTQHEIIKLLKMMDISKKDLFLDAGCGNGAPTRLIAKLYGCRIIGFDINPNQITKAEECNHLENVNHLIDLSVKDVHNLDFPEESFDKIFHNETICHWMYKKHALEGLLKILKKGGVMGFHDWAKGDKGDLNEAGGDFPGTYSEGIWFQNTIEETKSLLEEVGFTVLHFEDTTNIVDRGLRARLREIQMSKVYLEATSEEYFHKTTRYFKVMIETHYDYLRYGRFLCANNSENKKLELR